MLQSEVVIYAQDRITTKEWVLGLSTLLLQLVVQQMEVQVMD